MLSRSICTRSRRATRVWLPVAGAPILLAVVAVGLLAATDMSVADLYSVRTAADQFYLFHSVNPTATAIAAVTWLPALLAWLPWWLLRQTGWPDRHGRPASVDPFGMVQIRGRDITSRIVLFIAAVGLALPLAGLLIQISRAAAPQSTEIERLMVVAESLAAAPANFAVELRWTLTLSLATGVAAAVLAVFMVVGICRFPRYQSALHAAGLALWLIPGPLVGAAVAAAFSGPGQGRTFLATQTLVPTILACLPKALVAAYAILRVAVARIDVQTRNAASLDGGWWNRMLWVHSPLLVPSLAVSILIAGLIGGNDVAAQLPVLPPGVVTVGTRLFALLHSGARYQEATLTLIQSLLIAVTIGFAWSILRIRVNRPTGPAPAGDAVD